MDEHGKTYVGWTACFCDQKFCATGEQGFGKDSNFYFHQRELTDIPQLENLKHYNCRKGQQEDMTWNHTEFEDKFYRTMRAYHTCNK